MKEPNRSFNFSFGVMPPMGTLKGKHPEVWPQEAASKDGNGLNGQKVNVNQNFWDSAESSQQRDVTGWRDSHNFSVRAEKTVNFRGTRKNKMGLQIDINWPANPAGNLVQNYQIWESVDNGAFSLKASVSASTLTYQILNPLPGFYRWQVRAVNFVGNGPFSNVANGVDVPDKVGDLTVTYTVS